MDHVVSGKQIVACWYQSIELRKRSFFEIASDGLSLNLNLVTFVCRTTKPCREREPFALLNTRQLLAIL